MLRQKMIDMLLDFAGPVGPMRSAFEQIDARDAALAEFAPDDVDALLDLEDPRPHEVPQWIEQPAWREALLDTLVTAARRDPAAYTARLAPRAGGAGSGLLALEALGGIGDGSALGHLRRLVAGAPGPSEDAQVALVAALGAIGDDARADLEALDAALAGASAGVRQEIAIARSGRRLTHTRREIFERWKNLAAPAAVKDSLLKPRSRG